MDPLSLTASIIGVGGAATTTVKYLRRFTSLRDVPEQLLQLLNEVSR